MTMPPPLPQPPPVPRPPPLPQKQQQIPTAVYCVLFGVLMGVNVVLTYGQAVGRVPGDAAAAVGYLVGGLIVPLAVVTGIACIWKQNRGFRGVVRVLFWASLILLFVKITQLVSPSRSLPNRPAAGNA